jgi:hypothetical protein
VPIFGNEFDWLITKNKTLTHTMDTPINRGFFKFFAIVQLNIGYIKGYNFSGHRIWDEVWCYRELLWEKIWDLGEHIGSKSTLGT